MLKSVNRQLGREESVDNRMESVQCRMRNGRDALANRVQVSVPRRYARQHSKRDANHGDIAKALENIAVVIDTSSLGSGFPDLLVGYKGNWTPLEIKVNQKAHLLESQIEFMARCKTLKLRHAVVTSPAEALQAIEK